MQVQQRGGLDVLGVSARKRPGKLPFVTDSKKNWKLLFRDRSSGECGTGAAQNFKIIGIGLSKQVDSFTMILAREPKRNKLMTRRAYDELELPDFDLDENLG